MSVIGKKVSAMEKVDTIKDGDTFYLVRQDGEKFNSLAISAQTLTSHIQNSIDLTNTQPVNTGMSPDEVKQIVNDRVTSVESRVEVVEKKQTVSPDELEQQITEVKNLINDIDVNPVVNVDVPPDVINQIKQDVQNSIVVPQPQEPKEVDVDAVVERVVKRVKQETATTVKTEQEVPKLFRGVKNLSDDPITINFPLQKGVQHHLLHVRLHSNTFMYDPTSFNQIEDQRDAEGLYQGGPVPMERIILITTTQDAVEITSPIGNLKEIIEFVQDAGDDNYSYVMNITKPKNHPGQVFLFYDITYEPTEITNTDPPSPPVNDPKPVDALVLDDLQEG